ncbi:MAG: hypothetical protein JWQ43_2067 [Glaciihabitans sp.]|nr:hypothetical protein [Glaciihabitans sp.]
MPASSAMSPQRQRALALLVAGCFFMENLDGTILTTATPSIGRDFGVDSTAVGVTITAYLMTVAVLIPVSGWLTDRFGTRRVLTVAIAIFTLASLACALSASLPVLVIARIAQGIGGAMMVPVGQMTVLRVTEKKDLIRTVAVLTWPALVAPILAPALGGIITTYASWHWIFLVNVPLGIAGFFVALKIVPVLDTPAAAPPDWLGLTLACSGLGSLVFASSLLAAASPDPEPIIVTGVAGIVLLAFAVRHLLRSPRPFVNLRLARIATYGVALRGGSLYRFAISAIPLVLPLLFQDSFGWSPAEAGSIVLFLFVGNLAIKPATTWMLRRFGFRSLLVAAHLLGAACLAGMVTFTPSTPFALMAAVLVASGVTRSVGFTAYRTVAFADIAPDQMTGASVLDATAQQVASGTGVALGAIAISVGVSISSNLDVPGTFPYQFAFGLIALVLVASTMEAIRLPRSAGEAVTGRR